MMMMSPSMSTNAHEADELRSGLSPSARGSKKTSDHVVIRQRAIPKRLGGQTSISRRRTSLLSATGFDKRSLEKKTPRAALK